MSLSPPDILAAELERLVRGIADDDVSAYLESFATETTATGTKALIRWHRLTHDATLNQPQIEKLVGKLFHQLVNFACTRSEIEAASQRYEEHGTAEGFSALQEKARRLFTHAETTGEVGELLLYFLAERLLRYPQVLCKMPHKTNPNMHAHGADGVHGSVHPEHGHLRLHWGEAKLYTQLGKALDECCASLAELLLSPAGAAKSKTRDIELLRDFMDLENPAIEEVLQQYLDPDRVLSNKVEFCGLAVVGFDLADYEALCQEVVEARTELIAARVEAWSEKLAKALGKHALVGLTIDVFCIPFKDVGALRSEFLRVLGVSNGQR